MMKHGKLDFHSETGTEGGYFVLQDSDFITYEYSEFGVFAHRSVYDPSDVFRIGKVGNSYRDNGEPFESAERGDVSFLDISWEDGETDIGRPSDTVFVERWQYDGVIYIRDNDRLTIFEKCIGSLALWQGEVILEKQDPYSVGSFAPFGLASHYKPTNTEPAGPEEWSKWFIDSRWATLERKD